MYTLAHISVVIEVNDSCIVIGIIEEDFHKLSNRLMATE